MKWRVHLLSLLVFSVTSAIAMLVEHRRIMELMDTFGGTLDEQLVWKARAVIVFHLSPAVLFVVVSCYLTERLVRRRTARAQVVPEVD
jgi:hypothetical protein